MGGEIKHLSEVVRLDSYSAPTVVGTKSQYHTKNSFSPPQITVHWICSEQSLRNTASVVGKNRQTDENLTMKSDPGPDFPFFQSLDG